MIEVRLLGPLEVAADGVSLPVGPPKQQVVLAMLAVRPGRLVAIEELVDELWPTDPPASAVANTRSYAANLRRTLDGVAPTGGLLARRGSGYELRIRPDDVDLIRFGVECRQAVEARARGDLTGAGQLLCRAEELWRGPLLAGLPLGPVLSARRDAMEEQRLDLVEQRSEFYLASGQPRSAIMLLRAHLRTHPLWEHGHALLIRALYQDGDVPAALTAFSTARSALVEQLGIEPGPELRQLHQAVLNRDPALERYRLSVGSDGPALGTGPDDRTGTPTDQSGPSGPTGESQPDSPGELPAVPAFWLPRPLADFTGRIEAVRRLTEAVESADPTTAVVQVIDGMAGVGKTALAVHVATRFADRYPDAQLFVDLRGHSTSSQVEPATALVTLLRQLGVPASRIPSDFDHRVVLWRSELAARRSVLVLDNAHSSEQIGPLLPSTPGTLVLVTSRRRLLASDGLPPESLPLLGPNEAIELLGKVAGRERVNAEPEAAALVVRRCGYLPLAIRLVGARLAHRPGWRVADLAQRLDPDAPMLGELSAEDQTVASAFALSYEPLPERVRRLFRLLGLYPGEFFEATTAAALTGLPLPEAETAIGDLVDHHLVEEPTAGRFRLHDLLRQYAASLSSTVDQPDQRQAAIGQVLDHYLHAMAAVTDPLELKPMKTAANLDEPLRPELITALGPVDIGWMEAQRLNIRSLVRLAESSRHDGYTWRLARVAWRFYYTRGYFEHIIETHELGLRSAERSNESFAAATMYNYLASAYARTGNNHRAVTQLQMALEIRQRLGDTAGVAESKSNLAAAYWLLGRIEEAVKVNQSLALGWLRHGNGPDRALFNHGIFLLDLGWYEEALRIFRLSLFDARRRGDDFLMANTLGMLGRARLRMGHDIQALRLFDASIALRRDAGNHCGEAELRSDLAETHRRLGRLRDAEEQDRTALRLARETEERHAESGALNGLGYTLVALGNRAAAMESHRQALDLATRFSHPYQQGRALAAIAGLLESRDQTEARRHWERALAIFRKMGVPARFEVERRLAAINTSPAAVPAQPPSTPFERVSGPARFPHRTAS